MFFLGVLYHSAFHLELLGMLNRLTRLGGEMLLETTTDPRPDSAVRVRWQRGTGKAKMVPTFDALRIELAWTGWRDVTVFSDYRPESDEVLAPLPQDGRAGRWGRRRRGRAPAARDDVAGVSSRTTLGLTLSGVVLAAAAVWGMLGHQIEVPTVFGDELIHWDASRSLAAGDGLRVRDGGYGFGPIYPALLVPVHLLTADDLTRVPVGAPLERPSLRARGVPRLLPRPAAARARLEPRLRRVRRRDPLRALHGLRDDGGRRVHRVLSRAPRARPLPRAADRGRAAAHDPRDRAGDGRPAPARGARGSPSSRRSPLRFVLVPRPPAALGEPILPVVWPLLVVLGLATFALAVRIAIGNPLEGYGDLWRSYDAVEVARWSWRALAGLAVYLALVPLVLAPAALAALASRARRGDPAAAASVALFLSVNVVLVLVVGAFSSTEYGIGFLHDRYLFYVAPLWIVLTAWWAANRVPLRPVWLAVGAALTTRPARDLAAVPPERRRRPPVRRDRERPAVGARRSDSPRRPPRPAGRSSSPASSRSRSRSRSPSRGFRGWLVLVPLAVAFGLNAGFAWNARIDAARNETFAPMNAATTAWVDRAVPAGVIVATLAGGVPVETRDALRLTEFFNATIGPAYDLATGYAPTLSSTPVRVADGGLVVADTGRVGERWIVAPRDLELVGDVVAEGTVAGLRLWRVRPPVRVVEAP